MSTKSVTGGEPTEVNSKPVQWHVWIKGFYSNGKVFTARLWYEAREAGSRYFDMSPLDIDAEPCTLTQFQKLIDAKSDEQREKDQQSERHKAARE